MFVGVQSEFMHAIAAARDAMGLPSLKKASNRVTLVDIGKEPFRVFFPWATLAGIMGVLLWPLHLTGLLASYPGQAHARLMAYGLFGGFIIGFLGTAMPRMLSANPLGVRNVFSLATLHVVMVAALVLGNLFWGDLLLTALLIFFAGLMGARAVKRQDLPPPGFVLVGLAFVCVSSGAVLSLVAHWNDELPGQWIALQRLLTYQGFVLLPILGIGPFILPRFFGMKSAHDFPELLKPTPAWKKKATLALGTGIIIIASFLVEAFGWVRLGNGIRFAAALGYILVEFPFKSAPGSNTAIGFSLRTAMTMIVAGFGAAVIYPEYRLGVLHLTLIGGFAVLTFMVATRVVFGHSGNMWRLKGKNKWLLFSVATMLLAMATRISGDFVPKIMATHYIYGAILWVVGVLIWGVVVLPKVLQADKE